MTDLDRLGDAKYLLLTTFRRDGRAVATPVWSARDGDALYVWTAADSGKVKRVRNNGDVTLAPCDFRGAPSGEPVAGRAALLDQADDGHARAVIQRKYGVVGWLTMFGSRIRRGRAGTICMRISLP